MDVLSFSLWLILAPIILGVVWAYVVYQRMSGTKDANAAGVQSKHPVLMNPIFWAYALTPIIILIGAAIALAWLTP